MAGPRVPRHAGASGNCIRRCGAGPEERRRQDRQRHNLVISGMTSEAHTKGDPFGYVYGLARGREEKGWWHSFELPDGTVIDGVNTLPSLNERLSCFPIPGDLRGKRVLDIGTWDGW